MKADILLRGGTVVDGTGEPGYAADVAIADGRIVAIGDLSPSEAHRVIDVTGLVVAPGFIDIHTHSDLTVIVDPRCESKVRQGVTTDVTGNCGSSPFPLAPERIELHRNHLQEIDESVLGWTDLAGYSQVIERRPISFNVAPLVGHGTLRTAGMGHDRRAPTPQELATMKQLLVEQLTQGAFGFSTGLTLVPGAYADEEELVELVSVVAEHDALYATHTRGNGKGEFSGVELAVRTATRAGARLQFSHAAINTPDLWGRAADVTDILEGARAEWSGCHVRRLSVRRVLVRHDPVSADLGSRGRDRSHAGPTLGSGGVPAGARRAEERFLGHPLVLGSCGVVESA